MSVVAVLLLSGAAACSSSSSSDAEGGAVSGSGPRSASGSANASAEGGSDAGEVGADGSGSGGSGSGGSSGGDGTETLGGSDRADDTPSPSSSSGVLLGADDLPTPAADHCRTKDLRAKAVSTGQGKASVVLTNKGSGSCTVRGFPSLIFIGETGRTELPVNWIGSASDAAKVTLGPGDSASAALTFTALDECEEITGVDVVPPGEPRPLTPSFTSDGKKKAVHICDTGVGVKEFTRA